MSGAAARALRRQQVEELCAASIRALAGDPLLHLRHQRLYRETEPCPVSAPHLRLSAEEDDYASFRGASDGLALRSLHSDTSLHSRLRPEDDVPAMVFDMLEQFRVEALAPTTLPGVTANLRHRHRTWSAAFRRSGLVETHTGLLLYTLAQVCRSRVSGEPVDPESDELIEAPRFALAPLVGVHLDQLRSRVHEQGRYAVPARAIADLVAGLVDDGQDETEQSTGPRNAFTLFVAALDEDAAPPLAPSGDSRTLGGSADGYRVFTRAFDSQVNGVDLARPAAMRELRLRLDGLVSDLGVNLGRLTAELLRLLADPVHDGWDADREEGRVDGRRLARLVTSPDERRLFREPRVEPVADCVVTFLMDCSGSMRRCHETLAALLDVLARALDRAGVATEVLGFTTSAWNGGRAMREWVRKGRQDHPGRLNERRHLVFKDAETPWRRARTGIAALLREDLYREGIDGEAVQWAVDRLQARPEANKVLLVVSDGSPMDSATNLANDEHYLDQHLRQVVAAVEAAGEVRVCGLGVGLDLSPFYPRCGALDLDASTGTDMIRTVLELLAGHRRR